MSGYIGVKGKARKISKMYIGVKGKARRVSKAYMGVKGKARLVWVENENIIYYIGNLNFLNGEFLLPANKVTKNLHDKIIKTEEIILKSIKGLYWEEQKIYKTYLKDDSDFYYSKQPQNKHFAGKMYYQNGFYIARENCPYSGYGSASIETVGYYQSNYYKSYDLTNWFEVVHAGYFSEYGSYTNYDGRQLTQGNGIFCYSIKTEENSYKDEVTKFYTSNDFEHWQESEPMLKGATSFSFTHYNGQGKFIGIRYISGIYGTGRFVLHESDDGLNWDNGTYGDFDLLDTSEYIKMGFYEGQLVFYNKGGFYILTKKTKKNGNFYYYYDTLVTNNDLPFDAELIIDAYVIDDIFYVRHICTDSDDGFVWCRSKDCGKTWEELVVFRGGYREVVVGNGRIIFCDFMLGQCTNIKDIIINISD